jgi:hypothetical protein
MLARIAAAVAAGETVEPSAQVARKWADGRDFNGIWRHALRTDRSATSLPPAVQQSVGAWLDWEQADLGSVNVYAVRNTLPRLFAVHTSTDGDDGYLEIYDEEGRALASGTTTLTLDAAGTPTHGVLWDASFAGVRAALTQLQPPPGSTYQARFEAAFLAATGAPIAPTVTSVSEVTHIDLELQLGAATASARIERVGGRDVLSVSRVDANAPVQDAHRIASVEAALRADPRYPDASVIAVGERSTLTESFIMALFTTRGVERTVRIQTGGGVLQPEATGTMNEATSAREVAVALATQEALRRAALSGPLAQLEVLSRTFNGGARLHVEEPAAADRFGFDRVRDHKQFLVRDLWGASTAWITFTKAGGHRLDWAD